MKIMNRGGKLWILLRSKMFIEVTKDLFLLDQSLNLEGKFVNKTIEILLFKDSLEET